MPRSREKEWPSTHEVRNAGVDVDREVHQQAHHQPAENAEADENAQKLWHKAERRLVDGGRGLHHAQQHADGERGDDDGGRDQHQYPERLTRDGSEICCVHRPSPQVVKKLPASEPMVSAQPSTSTNSSSWNGSEISVGDRITMPSDRRTAETTRSSTRNRRKKRQRSEERRG